MAKQPLLPVVPKNFSSSNGDQMPDFFNFTYDPATQEFCLIDNRLDPTDPAAEIACWDSKATKANNKLNRVEYNVTLDVGANVLTPFTFLGESTQRYEGTPNSVLILVRTNGGSSGTFRLRDETNMITLATIAILNVAGYQILSAPLDFSGLAGGVEPTSFTDFVPNLTVVGGEFETIDLVQVVLLNLPID